MKFLYYSNRFDKIAIRWVILFEGSKGTCYNLNGKEISIEFLDYDHLIVICCTYLFILMLNLFALM